jgi:hypothetical protein
MREIYRAQGSESRILGRKKFYIPAVYPLKQVNERLFGATRQKQSERQCASGTSPTDINVLCGD